jgi:hypothetical protein
MKNPSQGNRADNFSPTLLIFFQLPSFVKRGGGRFFDEPLPNKSEKEGAQEIDQIIFPLPPSALSHQPIITTVDLGCLSIFQCSLHRA